MKIKTLLFTSLIVLLTWSQVLSQGNLPDSVFIADSERARIEKNADLELQILLSADSTYPNNYEILWRLSRSYAERASRVKITNSDQAVPQRKEFFSQSLRYAEKTKSANPDLPQGYYYSAIAVGGIIQYGNYKEMIKGSSVIKDNAEKTISLDNGHHRAMHILGRWHYEVARLSSFVKFIANIFYDEIPKGSYAEAVENFRKAASLKDLDIHRLWLAKSYIKLEENSKARVELNKIIEAPIIELNDSTHKIEAKKLLLDIK